MGYLKGFENIALASGYTSQLPSQEVIESFQIEVFNLVCEAYKIIKTSDKISEKPDETQISTSLFVALRMLCTNNSWVNCEHHEFTNDIIAGRKKPISTKRFDIYFGNWSTPIRIEYGVEAKLLIENDFAGKKSKFLIEEYVGIKGMNKYISGIYKERGCMLGYIVEGNIGEIVEKINTQVENVFEANQKLLKENSSNFKHKEIYKSIHQQKLKYPMFHLMLDFR
ncbi:MAG TPA: hypothetical protein VIJ75_23065 [Hanamia sp.]